jgi:hypothetical protein
MSMLITFLAVALAATAAIASAVAADRTLVTCVANAAPVENKICWSTYWTCTGSSRIRGVYFFLAVAGAACLLISLLSCCCFCCQKNPRKKAAKQVGGLIDNSYRCYAGLQAA